MKRQRNISWEFNSIIMGKLFRPTKQFLERRKHGSTKNMSCFKSLEPAARGLICVLIWQVRHTRTLRETICQICCSFESCVQHHLKTICHQRHPVSILATKDRKLKHNMILSKFLTSTGFYSEITYGKKTLLLLLQVAFSGHSLL